MFLINIRLNKCVIKTILENGGTLKSVQEKCNKAVDNYPHAL